jgi:predicted HTH transcriptional regulator
MTNVTLALPEDLHEKMKQFSEIRWSEVVRKTIVQKIEELEMMDKLTKKSKLSQKDVDEIASRIDKKVAEKLGLI